MATEEKIKIILAEQLGIEKEEIHPEDSLRADFHMTSTDLTELMQRLLDLGFEEEKLNLSQIETVAELIETLKSEEEI